MEIEEAIKDSYITKDLMEATILFALGKKIIKTEELYNKKKDVFFIFEDKNNCESILLQLLRRELRIDPLEIFSAQKTLKSIIFNGHHI